MSKKAPEIQADTCFESFDTKWIAELIQSRAIMTALLEELIKNKGKLWEPLIVWIHSWPWRGKSHLIKAFESGLTDAKIPHIATHKDKYTLAQKQYDYKKVPVIITDDLFQWANTLPKGMDDNLNPWWYDLQALPELIFDIYDGNKVWVVTSNFDINEILSRVAEADTVWRLKSRVHHLLASVQPLNLNTAPDHRELLAQKGTGLKKRFAQAAASALKKWN